MIARANKPTVRLVPIETRRERRVLGLNASPTFAIAADFDAPMADEVLWYDEPQGAKRKSAGVHSIQQTTPRYGKSSGKPRAK